MAAMVRLTGALRRLAEGRALLEAPPGPVSAVLEAVCVAPPALRARLYLADGTLWPDARLFLDEDDIRTLGGADTQVRDGQTLSVMLPVAGA
jgi:hypothetical protein